MSDDQSARLGLPWQDMKFSSVHSKDAGDWVPGATPGHGLYALLRDIRQHDRLAILTSPDNTPDRIARMLAQLDEALACGAPVAAYPVDGMLQCFGQSPAAALRSDLREAWSEALRIPRHVARDHAQQFAWARTARRFVAELAVMPRPVRVRQGTTSVPVRLPSPRATKVGT